MQSWTLPASKYPQRRRSSYFIIKCECVLSIPSTSAPHFLAMRMRPLSFKAFLPSGGKSNFHLMIERRNEKILPRTQVEASWFVFFLSELTFWPSPWILLLSLTHIPSKLWASKYRFFCFSTSSKNARISQLDVRTQMWLEEGMTETPLLFLEC